METDKKDYIMAAAILVVSAALGYGTSSLSDRGEKMFSSEYSVEVNSSNDVAKVEFDNNSVGILFEDSAEAKVYLDYNGDGSSDRQLNLSSTGSEQLLTEIVTIDRKSYEFSFRFFDNPEITGEAFLVVERIERIQ
ncbi:MAG: hypothetical protein ABEJ56_02755 [Candidatus Nanohaloarchaea archaeon]